MPDPVRIDDAGIPNDARLWRGCIPDQRELDHTGRLIPTEGAFRTQEVSMNLADETSMDQMLAKRPDWRLWTITAKQVRDAECIIVRAPEPDNPSHVLVLRRDEPGKRLSGGMATKLRRNGYWHDEAPAVIPPP